MMKKILILAVTVLFTLPLCAAPVMDSPTDSVVRIVDHIMLEHTREYLSNPEYRATLTAVAERRDEAAALAIGKHARRYLNLLDEMRLREIVNGFPEEVLHSLTGREMLLSVGRLILLADDIQAPDFTMNTPDGRAVRLSEYAAGKKVVLIDFWASWCAPCRRENPHVKAVYDKYRDRGFDVLGVSLDENAGAWTKAIEDDGLTWAQVSDLKGWGSEICTAYNFDGIPHLVLLDGNLRIIAFGPKVREALEEYVREYCE